MHGSVGQIGGMQRDGPRGRGDQINRSVTALHELNAANVGEAACIHCFVRTPNARRQCKRPQSGEPFSLARLRKRYEMHDDAAREPHRKQQAECDAQPAVQQNERAHNAPT